jgi:integrase
MRIKLAAAGIDTLPPGEYYDTLQTGLVLIVGQRRKTWFPRYRQGGKYVRGKAIGFFPQTGLKDARSAVQDMLKRLEAGLEPASKPAVHPASADALSVEKAIDTYAAMKLKHGKRIKTLEQNLKSLKACLGKKVLAMPVTMLAKADLRAVRDRIADKGSLVMANRFLGYLSPVLQWTTEEEITETNICRDIRRITDEEARDRVLDHDEIVAVWQAAETMQGDALKVRRNYGRMIQFLLLTGQRRGEAAGLRYADILDGIWFQKVNKANRPHKIKLSKQAMQLVGQGDPRDLVFGAKIRYETRKINIDKLCKVADWRPHDLRRTAATHMQDLDVDETIVRAILNHRIDGVSGVYLRSDFVRQKGEALQRWADDVDRIVAAKKVKGAH